MEEYVNQLIEDLNAAASRPPAMPFIEPPPHLEDDPFTAELALVPFKTIEEWTGINQELFPPFTKLSDDHCKRLNEAILLVLDSINVDLIDAPVDFSAELFYHVIVSNWQHHVQYLPSTGMDLELCTGNPVTCPYGIFCDCGDEPGKGNEVELPVHFNDVVVEIAVLTDAGDVCYLNPDSLAVENIPQMMLDDPFEFEAITGESIDEEDLEHHNWENYFVFEPLEPHESVVMMEDFVADLPYNQESEEILDALDQDKPFANFKLLVEKLNYRKEWFDFKKAWMEAHVAELLVMKLNNECWDIFES